jgi:hypothetical protein
VSRDKPNNNSIKNSLENDNNISCIMFIRPRTLQTFCLSRVPQR